MKLKINHKPARLPGQWMGIFLGLGLLAACAPVHPARQATQPAVVATSPAALPSSTAQPNPQGTTATTIANAQEFPDASQYHWQPLANGFDQPVGMTHAGDGSGRLFVLERKGLIQVLAQGVRLPTPFLDIQGRVGSRGQEQGLLGLAFHPQFKENGYFYVDYTNLDGDTVIARFHVDAGLAAGSQVADPDSEKVLLTIRQPYENHNGGQLAFGPDGFLYIGMGDGGSQGDPSGNAQSLNSLLGKILRIDVEHGDPYAIPPGNPFANGGGLPEILAYGLRNPWRFSFDTATGSLFIADVGQNKWEEIDFLPGGFNAWPVNFGWNQREGLHSYKNVQLNPAGELVEPIFNYGHDQGCSVIGGQVYRGRDLPAFNGIYLLGDYCSGNIWGLLKSANGQWQSSLLWNTGLNISSFGLDENGEIYLVDLDGGVYQLQGK